MQTTVLRPALPDQVSATLAVATGNLKDSINALTLPGVNSDASLDKVYNSRSGETESTLALRVLPSGLWR